MNALPGIGLRHAHYERMLTERPALGFVEVHSENFFGVGGAALGVLRAAREIWPVSLHGVGLALGSAVGVDPWHLDQLARLVAQIEPVRVSDHACFARAARAGGATVHGSDLLPIPFHGESLDVLCANVQRVQDRLKRPLLIENLSAYIVWAGSDQSETDFLNALAKRSGCQLLVDVNNIYVNALNAQLAGLAGDPLQACRQWLDAIAPGCVAEMHLAGHCKAPDIVIDDHGSRVDDAVWSLYRHACLRFGDAPTLIEWDTDVPALEVLLDEAHKAGNIANQTRAKASDAALPELSGSQA